MSRFLLDEHTPPYLPRTVEAAAPSLACWRIGDDGAPPLRSPDDELLIWCEDNQAYLVTNDRSSMPQHLRNHLTSGRHVPGIFVYRARFSVDDLIEQLVYIAGATLPDEYRDTIQYLPLI